MLAEHILESSVRSFWEASKGNLLRMEFRSVVVAGSIGGIDKDRDENAKAGLLEM